MVNIIGKSIFYITLYAIASFGYYHKSLYEEGLIQEYGINSTMVRLILVRHYGGEPGYSSSFH